MKTFQKRFKNIRCKVSICLFLSTVSLPAQAGFTPKLLQAHNKPDPTNLPLDELLAYSQTLLPYGIMAANSVLIQALNAKESKLTESDRAVLRNQIALNYRKLAELEAQSEHVKLAQPQLDKAQEHIRNGNLQSAKQTLLDLQKVFEARQLEQKPIGNVLGQILFQRAELEIQQGHFKDGFELTHQGISKMTHHTNPAATAEAMLTMARVYFLGSQTPLIYADMALNSANLSYSSEHIASALQIKGEVYANWGKADQALDYFQQAFKLADEVKSSTRVDMLLLMAQAHLGLNQIKSAQKLLPRILELVRSEPDLFRRSVAYLRLAKINQSMQDLIQAQANYHFARTGFETLANSYYLAQVLAGLASLELQKQNWQAAQTLYSTLIPLAEQVSYNKFIGTYYAGLGQALLELGQYQAAQSELLKSINEIRGLGAVDAQAIRESNEQLNSVYHAMIESYLQLYTQSHDDFDKMSHFKQAFYYLESSKSSVFLDELKGYHESFYIDYSYETISMSNDIREVIPADTLVLDFAQTHAQRLGYLSFTSKEIHADLISLARVLRQHPLYAKYRDSLKLEPDGQADFARVCQVYRQVLSSPQSDLNMVNDLGRILYSVLIEPHAAQLKQFKRLLVMPDGVLGLVPFETLIDSEGRYLIEKLDIQYVNSFDVLASLYHRHYETQSKPLLAIGNADYQPVSFAQDKIESSAEVLNLKRQIWQEPQASMREIYGALYAPQWQALPGSLAEIEALQKQIPQADVLLGGVVNEADIKALSENEQLQDYQILHWAVHGLSSAEIPELSALVLSQTTDSQSEDNYLRVSEIKQLKLNAELVTLSACETGLGKLFKGEGIVGLTQSFLTAGANRVIASLWQISDTATAELMPVFYRQLSRGYGAALSQTKREFAQGQHGDKYKHPAYWSPFVLYGKL